VAELAGKFPGLEILELVGHGSMGAVYKARQGRLDRVVALKILPPDRVRDPSFEERFTREARTLARLSHPHIVGVHDFGEADGLYYLVMEYVDGASLREVLHTGKLTPREALELVPQICSALQFAHEAGVVHRDVKPENILLDHSGNVKIADFGLAKLLDPGRADGVSLTVSGAIVGTPAYMAPEQIERPLEVDHRADIYAVGVVLYEMLTGELPLGRFDPPSSRVRMDIRLDEVVLRALAKEPTRRYQVAGDVAADLARLGDRGEAGRSRSENAARPSPPPRPAPRTPRADEQDRRTVTITRPALVTWIATYSFLAAGIWALGLFGGLVYLSQVAVGGVRLAPSGGLGALRHVGAPGPAELALITGLASLASLLALWHLIAGIGLLRLRNWARFNMIVLALVKLLLVPLGGLVGFLTPLLPMTVVSVLVLVYLFRPAVARLFELGRGPATLPAREADTVERVIGRTTWG
jgi:tRNA A-37 threonylcarbamoyl transferase component Bud32